MTRHMLVTALSLTLLAPFAASCVGESGSDAEATENVREVNQALGSEDKNPGSGPILGPDVGGPGAGWNGGFANDPNYAQYFAPRDTTRHGVSGRRTGRKTETVEHHRRAVAEAEYRRIHGGTERVGVATDGPLNDKARCIEACFQTYIADSGRCSKIPDDNKRAACREKASEDYALCVRDCSRQYPDPKL